MQWNALPLHVNLILTRHAIISYRTDYSEERDSRLFGGQRVSRTKLTAQPDQSAEDFRIKGARALRLDLIPYSPYLLEIPISINLTSLDTASTLSKPSLGKSSLPMSLGTAPTLTSFPWASPAPVRPRYCFDTLRSSLFFCIIRYE